MHTLKHLILIAALIVPAIPHAQEAVAQGGVGSGSAAAAQTMALENKLAQEAAQNAAQGIVIQELQQQMQDLQNYVRETSTISSTTPGTEETKTSCAADGKPTVFEGEWFDATTSRAHNTVNRLNTYTIRHGLESKNVAVTVYGRHKAGDEEIIVHNYIYFWTDGSGYAMGYMLRNQQLNSVDLAFPFWARENYLWSTYNSSAPAKAPHGNVNGTSNGQIRVVVQRIC